MSAKRISEIQEKAANKQVFLVEGTDDVAMWEKFFTLYQANWAVNWHIDYAGNKKQVVSILKMQTNWYGIIDTDEWQPEKIRELQTEISHLFTLPRYCAENYLIVPDEIWACLSPNEQAKIGDFAECERVLLRDLNQYVRHGALWFVINPLWEGLRSKGFKEDLLNIENAQNQQFIYDKLREWHDYLQPEKIEQALANKLAEIQGKQPEILLKHHIHGKKFFENVICKQFNQWFGQQNETHIRRNLIRYMKQLPDDILPIFQEIGL